MNPTTTAIELDVAAFNHYEAIAALLAAADLPVPGVADAPVHMLAALAGGLPVACADWERFGETALLRSVAVQPDWHGHGIGRLLVSAVCQRLWDAGVTEIHLLTHGAEGFFAKLGFRVVDRAAVPHALQASSSFAGECCAQATAMRRGRPG